MKDFRQEQPLVLVVDDERQVLDQITGILAEARIACRCCTTSEEALDAVREILPDLVLCDANFQGEKSGLDLYDRLRSQPGLEQVPVMLLSRTQLPDIIRRSHTAGGIYCLRKPFDPHVLVELIDQALGVSETAANSCPS